MPSPTPDRLWTFAGGLFEREEKGSAGLRERTRLDAENRELERRILGLEAELHAARTGRTVCQEALNASESTIADSAEWLAERDRLRSLVGRTRAVLYGEQGALLPDYQLLATRSGSHGELARLGERIRAIDAILSDPDGRKAVEWLEEREREIAGEYREAALEEVASREAKAREEGRREGLAAGAKLLRETAEAWASSSCSRFLLKAAAFLEGRGQ